jgi:Transcriptional antiterminator
MFRLLMKSNEMDIGTLSREMEVSERTIFREISSVNEALQDERIRISIRKSVLTIDGEAQRIQKLFQLLGQAPGSLLLTTNQRILFITAQLLLAEGARKSALFSYQLGLTEGAISLYMNQIEHWLQEKGMTLIRKRGYGTAVEGIEWTKRNALVTLIYEYKPVDKLLSYLYGVEKDPVLQYFFRSQFGNETLQTAQEILNLMSQEQRDDISYLTSLLHTMISVKKMLAKQPILLPESFTREALSANCDLISDKLREFLARRNIPVYESEIAYIAIHLPDKYLFEAEHRFQGLNVTVDSLAREVLDEVQKILGTGINTDSHMVDGVSHDLGLAVYRADMGIHVANPLLSQIKAHYAVLFHAVDQACKLVFSKYNLQFSPGEIGFVTMEIGSALETESYLERNLSILIVCPNGIFASRILYSKLKGIVRESDRIEVASLKEWTETGQQYNLVLSTIAIRPGVGANQNILVVSQFLGDEDITRIHEAVDRIRRQAANGTGQPKPPAPRKADADGAARFVGHMLDTLLVQYIPEEAFPKMVDSIAADLFERGIVSEQQEIARLFLQREKAGSVVIPGTRVSLLHFRSDLVNSAFFGVYRLQGETRMKGIGFVREPVDTFLVLLARKNENPTVLEKMGDISVALIEDKEFPGTLRAGNIDALHDKFRKILANRGELEGSLSDDGTKDLEK